MAMNDELLPAPPGMNWPEMLNKLQKERDELQDQVVQIRTERDQLAKALIDLLHEDVSLDEAEILAHLGKEKPLRELLQELRAEAAHS
jgi:uncharacterized coiled-coil DUF342 family protein